MKRTLANLVVLFLLIQGASFGTEGVLYDRIIAKVGSEIITEAEINRVLSEGLPDERGDLSDEELQKKALEKAIEEKLILLRARELGIEPTEKDVEASISSVMERTGMDQTDFETLLAKEGLTPEAYRRQIKLQILQNRILNRETASEGTPDDRSLKEYYETHKEEFLEPPRAHLRQIVLFTPKRISKKDLEQKAALILEIKKKAQQGEDFAELARRYSEDPTAQKGGDIGAFGPGELMPELEKELESRSAGELVGPFRSNLGFHLVKVEKKLPSSVMPFEEVKNDVKNKLLADTHQERFDDWLAKAKQEIYIEVLK
jgi:peptidyl-prolyl cis-trans isomerase SurA